MDSQPNQPAAAASENPVDRAFDLLLVDQVEAALRWAAAVVRSDPGGPVGLLLTGRALATLGQESAAAHALRLAAERALDRGNLPLAVAACLYLGEVGTDPSELLDHIANTFARGSEALLAKGAQPPRMPGEERGFMPLADALGGEALVEEAVELLKEADQHAEEAGGRRSEPPKVPPQPLFSSLDTRGLRAMLGIFDVLAVPRGETLVREGTPGEEAYVVARGELEVRRQGDADTEEGVLLARLGTGSLLGEMALLARAPRAASVVACRPSLVLVARKHALDEVVSEQPELGAEVAAHCRRRMVENLVRTSAILRAVKPSARPSLIERFVTRAFEEGDRLIVQDQDSEGLFLIASGAVEVLHQADSDATVIARLGVGEVVGEVALVLRRPATANVIAAMPTVTLFLHRDRFLDLIKSHPAVLAELYELAVKREEETSSIVGLEAMEVEDLVFI